MQRCLAFAWVVVAAALLFGCEPNQNQLNESGISSSSLADSSQNTVTAQNNDVTSNPALNDGVGN